MKRSITVAAILASAFALPVMADVGTFPNDWEVTQYSYEFVNGKLTRVETATQPAATAEANVVPGEKIVVTAQRDPFFENDWELKQYSYDFVNGKLARVDNLPYPDYPIPPVAPEDMVLQYPGA